MPKNRPAQPDRRATRMYFSEDMPEQHDDGKMQVDEPLQVVEPKEKAAKPSASSSEPEPKEKAAIIYMTARASSYTIQTSLRSKLFGSCCISLPPS